MGFDGVELVMEFEDEFGIEITDEAAGSMNAIGKVVDHIQTELKKRSEQPKYCPTSRSFYKVRQQLSKVLPIPRRMINPKDPLEKIIPIDRRQDIWPKLRSVGLFLPALERSKVVSRVSIAVVCAIPLAITLLFLEPYFMLTAIPLGIAIAYATRQYAVHIPAVCLTVGDLSVYATSMRDHDSANSAWSRSEVLLKVRMITAEQLGIPIDKIAEDSRFNEDLKMDR